ncbi:hypothetical protein, partial [Vibrio parahaemolyticus]|uniref:hypothetical protein n=1 Tax=Vibrio parahaemolyticus TaxID=670 RepID=UPI001C5EEDE6
SSESRGPIEYKKPNNKIRKLILKPYPLIFCSTKTNKENKITNKRNMALLYSNMQTIPFIRINI